MTDHELQQAIELYNHGSNFTEIANAIGRSLSHVSTTLRDLGFTAKQKEYDEELICKLYLESGLSQNKIAKRLEISPDKVREILKNNNINSSMVKHFRSAALSKSSKKNWQDPKYRDKMSKINTKINLERWKNPEYRQRMIENNRKNWDDSEYREKQKNGVIEWAKKNRETLIASGKERWSDIEYRKKMTTSFREAWTDERKERWSRRMKEKWQNQEYRDRVLANLVPTISKLQKIVYSILDDFNVEYLGESEDLRDGFKLGPWSFDCYIDSSHRIGSDKHLLIEVQGEWVHGKDDQKKRDKQKYSYILNNFNDQYELVYIREKEFLDMESLIGKIKLLLGIKKIQIVNFSFDDLVATETNKDILIDILSKYHYLRDTRRHGVNYACMLGDEVIACCVISPLSRIETASNYPYTHKQIRELSRFCIKPSHQKKNLGSWFLSRAVKLFMNRNPECKMLVSFADSTFGHNGTIYKAAGWVLDGETKPDYTYYSKDGWVMHKKTLYNKAQNLCLTEAQYAEKHGFDRRYGKKKYRYIVEL